MQFQFYCATDTGLMREHNEDAVAHDVLSGVAILADGIGGYNAGEVASGMAAAGLNADLGGALAQQPRMQQDDLEWLLHDSVERINIAIYNRANAIEQYRGMGTTLVLGVFRDRTATIAHVGDSRAYCLREGQLMRLTKDHSLVQEQVDLGLLTEDEAQSSLSKSLVTRAVGIEPHVVPEVRSFEVQDSDLFLLCSDGLSDMVNAPRITEILSLYHDDLPQAAATLIAAANEAGGRDNISVMLVHAQD